MAQIKTKFLENSAVTTAKISNDAVTDAKIRLSNDAYLRARNAADSGDVNIIKVDSSDRINFASVPQSPSDASSGNDLVRYSQFSAALDGLKPKAAVVVASTGNIDLSVAADPNPIDGHSLSNGDRILLWQQTDDTENGIYDAVDATDPTTWTRSTDFDAPSEIPGAYTVAEFGTLYQGVLFVSTSSPGTIGADPINFAMRSITVNTYTGGDMISIDGSNVVSVDLLTNGGLKSSNPGNAAGQLEISLEASNPSLQISGSNELGLKIDSSGGLQKGASGVSIKSDTVTADTIGVTSTSNGAGVKFDSNSFTDSGSETLALAAGVAGAGLALTTGVLSVNVDDSTIEINVDTLRVKDAGITLAKLASDSVDENKIVSTALSSSGALAGGSGTKLSVKVDASTVKINGSDNLESLKHQEEEFVLDGTDITNQYVDLAHAIWGASASLNSASLFVVGGPMQRKAVDYTVSLTGGSGGVTRITFDGDLATAGAAELVATDVLVISYDYLT